PAGAENPSPDDGVVAEDRGAGHRDRIALADVDAAAGAEAVIAVLQHKMIERCRNSAGAAVADVEQAARIVAVDDDISRAIAAGRAIDRDLVSRDRKLASERQRVAGKV